MPQSRYAVARYDAGERSPGRLRTMRTTRNASAAASNASSAIFQAGVLVPGEVTRSPAATSPSGVGSGGGGAGTAMPD